METIKEEVKKLREEGLSVRQIAYKIGKSKSYVAKLVEGMPYALPPCEYEKALSTLEYDRAKELCQLEQATIAKIGELLNKADIRSLPALIQLLKTINDVSAPATQVNTMEGIATQLNNIMNLQINVNK